MPTVSTSFTAVGPSAVLTVQPGKSITYSVSGTFVGTVQLEESNTAGAAWKSATADAPPSCVAAATASASGTVTNKTNSDMWYRIRCTAYTSGTIVTSIADASDIVYEVRDPKTGALLLCVKDDGVVIPGALTVGGIDETPESSTYTGAFTGTTTDPAPVIRYTRIGKAVILYVPAASATSNATTFTITGAPASIRPARAQTVLAIVRDNNTVSIGTATMGTNGALTLGLTVAGSAFTATGTKGMELQTLPAYSLD